MFVLVFSKGIRIPTATIPPLLFYLGGFLLWSLFSQSLEDISSAFTVDSAILTKTYFPKIILPLSCLVWRLYLFAINLVVFLCLYFFYLLRGGTWRPSAAAILWLPVGIFQISLLAVGLGLILACTSVRVRDIQHVSRLLLQLWMFATPIIYPMSMLPSEFHRLISLNPMSPIVEGFRIAFFNVGHWDPFSMVWSWAVTLAVFVIGLFSFSRTEITLVDTL